MSRSPDGKKPFTRLATLATLSPEERGVDEFVLRYTKIVGTNSKKSLKTKEDAS